MKIKPTTIAIYTLATALATLVAVNCFVVYWILQNGYIDETPNAKRALHDALKILPIVAEPGTSRQKILAALSKLDSEPFLKDGYTCIDFLILRFDARGRLVEAHASGVTDPDLPGGNVQ